MAYVGVLPVGTLVLDKKIDLVVIILLLLLLCLGV